MLTVPNKYTVLLLCISVLFSSIRMKYVIVELSNCWYCKDL